MSPVSVPPRCRIGPLSLWPSAKRLLPLSSPLCVRFTDDNYPAWLVNIRAHLRPKKLWKYTQSKPDDGLTLAQLTKWINENTDAAGAITSTISDSIKLKISEDELNDGFIMITRVAGIYRPKGDNEFMRLTKEYYSVQHDFFRSHQSISYTSSF